MKLLLKILIVCTTFLVSGMSIYTGVSSGRQWYSIGLLLIGLCGIATGGFLFGWLIDELKKIL